ncbi:T9SS type A sorting domain-containing protein, partial [Bacteroidia bacterium]|nr:T9SS type A sorting domain-containing protein [Bacteroidia bacterium]
FPNPSTGTFCIQGVQDYTIIVRDLNGKLFQLTKLTNDEFYLPQNGLYFIELTNQDTGLRNVKKLLVK